MDRILLVRVARQDWMGRTLPGHMEELRRFFTFWLEKKLGVKAEIDVLLDTAIYASSRGEIAALKKFYDGYDLYSFITDKVPDDISDKTEGFETEGYSDQIDTIIVLDTRGPDAAPLHNITRILSHEFLHFFGRRLGWPHETYAIKVDRESLFSPMGDYYPLDRWAMRPWWDPLWNYVSGKNWLRKRYPRKQYYLVPENRVVHGGYRYTTQGGEYG